MKNNIIWCSKSHFTNDLFSIIYFDHSDHCDHYLISIFDELLWLIVIFIIINLINVDFKLHFMEQKGRKKIINYHKIVVEITILHYETEDAINPYCILLLSTILQQVIIYFYFISHSTIAVAWSKMFHFKINLPCCEKWLVSNSETLYGWQHNNYHN